MPRKFMITGALPYSNGRLHVGHIAGAYLPADTYVRYLRAIGDEVRFVCGSDDNGVAIPDLRRQGGQDAAGAHRLLQRPADGRLRGPGHRLRHLRRHAPAGLRRTARPNSARTSSRRSTTRATSPRRPPSSSTTCRPTSSCPTATSRAPARTASTTTAYGDQCENCGQSHRPADADQSRSARSPAPARGPRDDPLVHAAAAVRRAAAG